jgi:gas vesicle protein
MAKKKGIVRKAVTTVAVGTTVGAVLAAGAAAYFFTQTKSGKAAAKKIKSTAVGLSREIGKRVHAVQKLSQSKYNDIVEEVVDEYAAQKKVGKQTVKSLKKDLKTHWKEVQRELKKK